MREALDKDRNLVALTSVGLVFLLFLVFYYLPRSAQLQETRQAIQALTTTRQEVAILLPQVIETAFTTPEPADNVRSWISTEALKGLEKQMIVNDGYLEGKGAQVKLRRLSAPQVGQFFSQLTRARLVIERMTLQDSDRDGRWDMDIDLRVPASK